MHQSKLIPQLRISALDVSRILRDRYRLLFTKLFYFFFPNNNIHEYSQNMLFMKIGDQYIQANYMYVFMNRLVLCANYFKLTQIYDSNILLRTHDPIFFFEEGEQYGEWN